MEIGIGIAIGAVVGLGIGLILVKGKSTQLQRTQEEFNGFREQAGTKIKQVEAKAEAAAKQLAATKEQLAGTEKALAQERDRVQQLTTKVKETEGAHAALLQQANAQQSARQQAEGRMRQAEKLAAETRARLEQADAQLRHVTEAAQEAQQKAQRQAEEVHRLRAELSSGSASGLEDSVGVFAEAEGSLNEILQTFLEREAQKAVVLADTNGIVVASAGDKDLRDGMAAASQLVSRITTHFEGLVPFSAMKSFSLADADSQVLAGRAFTAAGEPVALATYGSHAPNVRLFDGAIASLAAVLE